MSGFSKLCLQRGGGKDCPVETQFFLNIGTIIAGTYLHPYIKNVIVKLSLTQKNVFTYQMHTHTRKKKTSVCVSQDTEKKET